MIIIDEALHIGTGRDRECYLSPNNANICIKISKKSNKQSRREVAYYKFLMSKKCNLSFISQYYGSIITDRGKGECFEVIRDYDDKISLTLRQCIEENCLEEQVIYSKLDSLKEYLITNKIVARDLSPANIMIRKLAPKEVELKIIDGLGNPSINPLTIRLAPLVTKAILKSFESLMTKTKRELAAAKDLNQP